MDRISVKSRGRVTVTRQAHNLKIVGAIPAPATSIVSRTQLEPLRIRRFKVLQLNIKSALFELVLFRN